MRLKSRFWAGICGAVAGGVFALLVQVIGTIVQSLSIEYLMYTMISFAITGFLIGFVVGRNQTVPVSLVETSGVHTRILRWRIIPVVLLAGIGLIFTALGLSGCRNLWLAYQGDWHILISLGFLYCVCMTCAGVAWILAAITFARRQWLFGWTSVPAGFLLFASMFVIQHYMFYNADVDTRRQPEVAAEPTGPNAESVLKTALSTAKLQNKQVLVYLGAPSCGACRKLEKFLNNNQSLFNDDYIVTKIDLADMKMATVVENRLRQGRQWGMNAGIPWMAILDADGKELISSDGPKGNIGYPLMPEEIDYFTTMLEKTHKRMSSERITAIRRLLEENATEYRKKKT